LKLYLFEKQILKPLNDYLQKENNMSLEIIKIKYGGLDIIAPIYNNEKIMDEI
jgi:hypothetical protein